MKFHYQRPPVRTHYQKHAFPGFLMLSETFMNIIDFCWILLEFMPSPARSLGTKLKVPCSVWDIFNVAVSPIMRWFDGGGLTKESSIWCLGFSQKKCWYQKHPPNKTSTVVDVFPGPTDPLILYHWLKLLLDRYIRGDDFSYRFWVYNSKLKYHYR